MRTDQARPVLERLVANSVQDGKCIVWMGLRDKDGYGRIKVGSRTDDTRRECRTHVLALELKLGRPLTTGMQALHHCDNPPCIYSDHLYEGTPGNNVADAANRGRDRRRATHCKHGHEFTPENTYWWEGTGRRPARHCRKCRRARKRVGYVKPAPTEGSGSYRRR